VKFRPPFNLEGTMDQMRLCAAGIDDAPPLPDMAKAMQRMFQDRFGFMHRYFVWAHRFELVPGKRGPVVLLVERENDREPDDSQEMVSIYDSRRPKITLPELCQWFFDEIEV
jgi:hypothetical protein